MYQLEKEMPYTELLKWVSFFKHRPVGWREDHRTYLLLKAQGYKGKPEDLFQSLRAIKIKQEEDMHRAESDTALPKGMFLSLMVKAKGGDNSGWEPKIGG